MATLTQTLGTSPLNSTFKYPSLSSPYPLFPSGPQSPSGYGANVNYAPVSPYFVNQPQAAPPQLPSNQFSANYDFDPVLAKIAAMSSMTVDKARAAAQAAKNEALITSGDS